MLANDALMLHNCTDWLVRETIGLLRRTLARLDVSSRTIYTIIEPGSCFAGILFELVAAADRSYMLATEEGDAPKIALDDFNGMLPAVNDRCRLATRFNGDADKLLRLEGVKGMLLGPKEALQLELITVAPDDLDWEDEVRIAIEERASLSPDALTGLEASLQVPGRRNAGNEDLRTPFGVAELGIHPPQLHRRTRSAQAVRNRIKSEI